MRTANISHRQAGISGSSELRVPTWKSQRQIESPNRTDWPTVREESRQHYANVRIAEFQRFHLEAEFSEVLRAFREYGLQYDLGHRLASLPSI